MKRAMTLSTAIVVAACASGGGTGGSPPPTARSADTSRTEVPPGLGSLKQDDIALHLSLGALQVKAIPLDESIIRLLAPDSYRSLRDLRSSQEAQALAIVRRAVGSGDASVWYVSFFSAEPGETRFAPTDVVITSAGRDFRPLDLIPLTPGFGSQRLRQRESQSALYVFDGQVDVNQSLTLQYESARATDWSGVLERVERERVLGRTRAKG